MNGKIQINGLKMVFMLMSISLMISATVSAGTKASITKMHEMVVMGYEVVQQLGDEAYEGINKADGEFVWKNADGSINNVGVIDCQKGIIAADYEVPGLEVSAIKDAKTGAEVLKDLCQNPSIHGKWIEFDWVDEGRNNETHRAILFYIPIPEKSLLVYSFAWDDEHSLLKLNSKN